MGIFSKIFGEQTLGADSQKQQESKKSASKLNLFNPLPDGRNRILAFDSTLISLAASGIHDKFDRSLHVFHSELTVYNSNISRYLVREYKQRSVRPTDRLDPVRAQAVQELFLEHNRAYISISSLIKQLREDAPLLSQSMLRIDDLNLLDESQKQAVFGSLLNIRISLSSMEDIWEKLIPYEQQLFN
jgi:hypothetical protein